MPIPNSPLVVSAILYPFGDHAEKWDTPRPTPLWEVSSMAIVTIGPLPSASALWSALWTTEFSTIRNDENTRPPPSGDQTGNV